MAYKRQSPLPIVEGGTNAQSMATTNGVLYYNTTSLVTTGAGTSGQLLTSNGNASAPTYQNSGGGGGATSFMIAPLNSGFTGGQVISQNDGFNSNFYTSIWGFGSQGDTETLFEFPIPISGTLSNFYVSVLSNSASNSITYSVWQNGSTTSLGVTIGAGATGLFTNLVNTVAVSAGDLIQFIANNTSSSGQVVKGHTTLMFSS